MNKVITVAFAAICAVSAHADLVSYDAQLASPNGTAFNANSNPSWYDGSGNAGVQGGWTVDTNNGIELGLRAKYRQGAQIDSSTNLYNVVAGPETAATGQGLKPGYAAWSYEFSIDLRPGGAGTLTLSDISSTLNVTDLTTGASVTINPLGYTWYDNSFIGTSQNTGDTLNDKHAGTVTPFVLPNTATSAPLAGDYVVQNSENPNFGDFPLTAAFTAPAFFPAKLANSSITTTGIYTSSPLPSTRETHS